MEQNKIRNVSDTALWVAHYRALESERSDALFKDPYAKILVGERGRQIAEDMGRTHIYIGWAMSIRTHIIDEFIKNLIAEGFDTIVNLGAGLDTRPYRMPLPPHIDWIEVDYPHMIDHKEKLLKAEKPVCNLERIRLDLSDVEKRRAMLSQVAKRSQNILVLTEGVIPYLTETQVAELADDLYRHDSFKHWIAEYFAPQLYKYWQKSSLNKKMKNAPFLFYPTDWFGFFKTHHWVPREVQYLPEVSEKLRRKIPKPWWAFIFWPFRNTEKGRMYRKFNGYVLFQREN